VLTAAATAGLVLAFLGAPFPARAAGEEEWQLAARTGTATVNADGRTTWGFAAGLDLEYGLTDAWAVRTSVATSLQSVGPEMPMDPRPSGKIVTTAALAGLTYTIDILRLVPYGDFQLGGYRVDGAVTKPGILFVAAIGIGADFYLTRRWTAGGYFQYLFSPVDLFSDPFNLGSNPYQFSATLKISRIF
jgi:Outer membrane protein beta-barrel domain